MDALEALDAELARLSRSAGALRLALGRGLEALARQNGHHELGFSSLEAYALERCERCARWVQESRALARRLETLPSVRSALVAGRLTWSAAGIVAKALSRNGSTAGEPQDEARWLTLAETLTVRVLDKVARGERIPAGLEDPWPHEESPSDIDEPFRTLTVTVDLQDAWLFEAARRVVDHVAGARDADTAIEALVAEGFTTAQRWLPRNDPDGADEPELDPGQAAQRAWEEQCRTWRDEAEQLCEGRFRGQLDVGGAGLIEPAAFDGTPETIDQEVRRVASQLLSRDLAMGEAAEALWQADGWRRLGYATETQYVRERLGCSLASVKAKRALARKARELPRLRQAVVEGMIGYEAARLVSSVADAVTLPGWIDRAGERTVKHLREEVDAARTLASLEDREPTPPDEDLMYAMEALESCIVSGAVFQGSDRKDDGDGEVRKGGDDGEDAANSQMSSFEDFPGSSAGPSRGAARVTLRLGVRHGTYAAYRWLERRFQRRFGRRLPFFMFLCRATLETWKPALGGHGPYADIYARDRYRCRSPVCSRRDLTPHHVVFRSHGGDESAENLLTLCVWCHLDGVHGGRLGAQGPASHGCFGVGRRAHTVVDGRRRARQNAA